MNIFFIVGEQRSGTTMLSAMLGNHPEIFISHNSYAFRLVSCFDNLQQVLPYNLHIDENKLIQWLIETDYKGRVASLLDPGNFEDESSIRQLVANGIESKLQEEGKSVFGDKAPNMQYFLPQLLQLIPNAKMIHLVRDGRATACSAHLRAKRNLYLVAQQWVDGNIAGLVHQAMLGKHQYHLVRYEDILTSPQPTLQSLCDFLEIEFSDRLVHLDEVVPGKSDSAYVKPILDASKTNAFRDILTPRQIKRIEQIQGPLLRKLGYSTLTDDDRLVHKQMSVGQRIWYNQAENFHQLFRSKTMGMQSRMNVEVQLPFSARLKKFLRVLGQDLLPEQIYKRLFRRVWIKELFYPNDNQGPGNTLGNR